MEVYQIEEKVKIKSTKEAKYPFGIVRESSDETVGYGYTKEGIFYFLDLEECEPLTMAVSELAKIKKRRDKN
jgi:hypothetical protein